MSCAATVGGVDDLDALLDSEAEHVERHELFERAARMMFDKANPDVPHATGERDRLFDLTRDYWLRAVRELAELLGWMHVSCPCGWTLSGPARELSFTARTHKCEKTYPWWGQQRDTRDG